MIANPILPGFHPDPSAVRVGDRYVIATSTFQWLPGISLHDSTDLARWRPIVAPIRCGYTAPSRRTMSSGVP